MSSTNEHQEASNPIREILEPFKSIFTAPRALQAVNFSYFLEGLCYFGILTLLALSFNNIGLSDQQAGWVVGAFTGGITLSMFFFGELADRWGVRTALLLSLVLMFIGRIFLASSGLFGGTGLWSPAFISASFALLMVVLGYGMYMPAAYAAVRKFADEKSASMGYALLYGLMNLGAFLAGIISPPIRHAQGMSGVFWVYTALTLAGIIGLFFLMTKRSVAAASRPAAGATEKPAEDKRGKSGSASERSVMQSILQWFKEHPLADPRFSFFIFILIPVQTLFAHQWLTIPQYVFRAYPGFVSDNMETFVNINPLLIFFLTPFVAALTRNVNVYKMMILGTFVMAIPTFLLALGPNMYTLFTYILLMSIGEAMWQPRFLQLAAEIAPEGKTGQYMGIAQFPWFLTKLITSTYSGAMLTIYCPQQGALNTEMLWLIYGGIAMISPIALLLAKGWMSKGLLQTKKG
jgi:MFS family permease